MKMCCVTDAFLETWLKFSEQLSQRAIVFSYRGYSGRNGWVIQRLNKECFTFSGV